MDIAQVARMAAAALALGWITRKGQRMNVLLLASIFAIFWLQPALRLRYLDFFLPAASIGITVLAWALTSSRASRQHPETKTAAAIILATVLLLACARYIDMDGFAPAPRPPAMGQVIFLAGIFTAGAFFLTRVKPAAVTFCLWAFFFVILAGLLTLKTPALSLAASRGWRFFARQNIELASAFDIHWLGYSYLAFRLLHTVRDRQTGQLPDVTLGEYVTYVVFFPAFSAGPIARIEHFIAELRQPAQDFESGGKRLAIGVFKKFVIADTLEMIALNSVNASQAQTALGAWILLYAYAFQIYFDFAGYTDIAIGMARWLGISLPENFRQPYLQPNLTLFWNNWHITLTQWFRAYVFNPLARALRSQKRLSAGAIVLVAQTTTMLLIGAWHGVTWNYILWGLWHGCGLFTQNRWSSWSKPRLIGLPPYAQRVISMCGVLATFHYVALGWVFFALPNPNQVWHFILRLWGVA